MDKNEVMKSLTETFQDRDWFAEVGLDAQTKRVTVYVHYMNLEVMTGIPMYIDGHQIMTAFVGWLRASSQQFTENLSTKREAPSVEDVTAYAELVNDGPPLIDELDRLEKICGSNMLQDIFYEVHDGKNAVTNLSSRYPEVRSSLEKLYSEYGFDVIYEELDG